MRREKYDVIENVNFPHLVSLVHANLLGAIVWVEWRVGIVV